MAPRSPGFRQRGPGICHAILIELRPTANDSDFSTSQQIGLTR